MAAELAAELMDEAVKVVSVSVARAWVSIDDLPAELADEAAPPSPAFDALEAALDADLEAEDKLDEPLTLAADEAELRLALASLEAKPIWFAIQS